MLGKHAECICSYTPAEKGVEFAVVNHFEDNNDNSFPIKAFQRLKGKRYMCSDLEGKKTRKSTPLSS